MRTRTLIAIAGVAIAIASLTACSGGDPGTADPGDGPASATPFGARHELDAAQGERLLRVRWSDDDVLDADAAADREQQLAAVVLGTGGC